MSLRVHGIVMHDGHAPPNVPMGAQILPVRELAAITEEGPYSAHDLEADVIERHMEIVESVFRQDAIIPAPPGTIFRSAEVLQRWMELHYVALSDALAWIEDRVGARVHVSRAHPMGMEDDESGGDLATVSAEITKSLRRHAVAVVPLRTEHTTGFALSAAYLVERSLWQEFTAAVGTQGQRYERVRAAVTGPWPPYDFVRMQFGT